jgi:hypothetical protein
MAKVVNLNRFRKQKAKAERTKRAEVNRRLHGRTKAERAREALQKEQLTKGVEGAKLEGTEGEQPLEPEGPDEGEGCE